MERYDEQETIGRGGMSSVLRVFDRLLLRETAQKVMDKRFSGSARHLERFISEAQITGQLEHPNIVPIHDYGVNDEGQPYINMKLVEGETLGDLVEAAGEDRLHPDVLAGFVRILLKACDALAFAHSKGVLHCDLNPANIMVGPFGEVYLMDWGVSTRRDGSPIRSETTRPTTDISGTPAYMAPEQIRGQGVDERTDVFALGATLYFVLVGHPPYPGPSAIQALNQALEVDYVPLESALGSSLPAGLDVLIDRCMARAPEARFPTVLELQRDLDDWLRGRWHLPKHRYTAGDVVVREGDDAAAAFLIVEGSCEARRIATDSASTLSVMGPGDVFGQMAIFGEVQRTSSVVATSDLTVQVVTRTDLATAVGLDSWVGQFVTSLTSRFLETETELRRLQGELDRMKTQLEALESSAENP